jgi:hypothetical protein
VANVSAQGQANNFGEFYDEISASYRAIDDFRTKLLGFLPVATGGAVFLLLNSEITGNEDGDRTFLGAAGALGFVFTLGLFSFELHGIKKCHSYIRVGKLIEAARKAPGQFVARPRDLGWVINEPFASSLIYPASLAAWLFTAVVAFSDTAAAVAAGAVFLAGFVLSFSVTWFRKAAWDREIDDHVKRELARRVTLGEPADGKT